VHFLGFLGGCVLALWDETPAECHGVNLNCTQPMFGPTIEAASRKFCMLSSKKLVVDDNMDDFGVHSRPALAVTIQIWQKSAGCSPEAH